MSFRDPDAKPYHQATGESSLTIPHVEIRKGTRLPSSAKNGSGKSSLLNILNGTDRDFQGEISLDHLLFINSGENLA